MEAGSTEKIADVTVFNTETGQVEFTPKINARYLIKVWGDAGKRQEIALPVVQKSGVSLKLLPHKDTLQYTIQLKEIPSNGAGSKLVGTIHDQLVFLAVVKKSDGIVTGSIDTKTFPAGVFQLTLFNESGEPMAHRLCFINLRPLKTVMPLLQTDTISFADKGYNHWSLSMDSVSWHTWSVQVSDASFAMKDHFLGDLYLRSDFTVPIQNADGYFENADDKTAAALDALLITEKWERFNWQDIIANRFPVIRFKPDDLLTYTATVSKGKKLQPLKQINLLFQTKNSAMEDVSVTTDAAGKFLLKNISFTDTVNVFFAPDKRKIFDRDIDVDFVLLNRFFPFNSPFPPSPFITVPRMASDTLPLAITQHINNRSKELLLTEKTKMRQELVIRTKAHSTLDEMDKKLSSSLFNSGTILFRGGLLYPDELTLKAPIRFFSNSTARRFRIIITGFTEDGTPVIMQRDIAKDEINK